MKKAMKTIKKEDCWAIYNTIIVEDNVDTHKLHNVLFSLYAMGDVDIKLLDYISEYKSEYFNINSPSKMLESKFNIKRISYKWRTPFNIQPILADILFQLFSILPNSEVIEYWCGLFIKINPKVLSILNVDSLHYPDTTNKMLCVVYGMISGYTYDDIYEYIVNGSLLYRSVDYQKKYKKVSNILNVDIKYLPSDASLDKMIKPNNSFYYKLKDVLFNLYERNRVGGVI